MVFSDLGVEVDENEVEMVGQPAHREEDDYHSKHANYLQQISMLLLFIILVIVIVLDLCIQNTPTTHCKYVMKSVDLLFLDGGGLGGPGILPHAPGPQHSAHPGPGPLLHLYTVSGQ
jgi:hypothetical protein